MKRLLLVIGLALLASYPAGARAGILDAPPNLNGRKSLRLYSATGVMSAGGLGTFFSCTNASQAPADISVELYVDAGGPACNDANAVALTVAPGGTVLFSTQNNADSSFFSSQPLSSVPMFLSLGSASIVSTQKSLVCTAFVADVYNSPPSSMLPLKLVGKKQRGD